MRSVQRTALLALLVLIIARTSQSNAYVPRNDPARIQQIVNELLEQLAIPNAVTVHVVAVNPLLASVEPNADRPGAFHLFLEDAFLDELDRDELYAVVAHELGHVWVFTHHPFLQTEQLANQVAMRVVSRDILQRVYTKVFAHSGSKGDVVHFLGN